MKIITITGPSGSGKTSILRAICEGSRLKNITELISHTTRQKRSHEKDGVDYNFVSEKTFNQLDLIENVEYAGNHYGLTRQEADNKIKAYDYSFVIVDNNGVKALKQIYGDNVACFFVRAHPDILLSRLVKRSGEKIALERMAHMKETKENIPSNLMNFVIDNNYIQDLCKAVDFIESTIRKGL